MFKHNDKVEWTGTTGVRYGGVVVNYSAPDVVKVVAYRVDPLVIGFAKTAHQVMEVPESLLELIED